jgi:SAM-dependent methyltransferase
MMNGLDDVGREHDLHKLMQSKPALKLLYNKFYQRYIKCIERCPPSGPIVEIGSGASFAKEIIPDIITSDILPYSSVDICVDARQMPFRDRSLRAILMLNTLHHIPDAERFFSEARRCLRPNGRILIVDQYPGWLSYWIFKFLHHEPFNEKAETWQFDSTGPLSCANGALCWIIFYRDREKFKQLFPELCIDAIEPHSPLCYWLAGGLKPWSLLPKKCFRLASMVDDAVSAVVPQLSSFVDIELVRC